MRSDTLSKKVKRYCLSFSRVREVSATLKALELSHTLEEKCEPFYLDITTSFAQINAMHTN